MSCVVFFLLFFGILGMLAKKFGSAASNHPEATGHILGSVIKAFRK